MYYMDEKGGRVYTLKVRAPPHPPEHKLSSSPVFAFVRSQKAAPDGKPTESAHPARFSPDDKFSKHRLICKKRFGLLPMQQPKTPL